MFRAAAILLICGISVAAAQAPKGDAPATANPPTRGTLPPLEVTPDAGDAVLSPSDATLPSDFNAPPSDAPWDLPGTFPSLTQQQFNGPGSVLRGNGSIFDTPQAGTIVDRNQLNERNASDISRAIEGEVGVLMQSTARGQSSPFVRGLTGQEVLLLIDGIRLNNSTFRFGPNQYFGTIDPGQVDRVEVLRGPQSVAWGSDAIGGAINIVTREADWSLGDGWNGSAQEIFSSADMASYTRLNGENVSGNLGVFAGASYLNVNNLDRGGDLGRQPFTNFDQYAGDIKFQYALDCNQLLTVSLSHFEQQNVPRSDRFLPFVAQPTDNGTLNRERPTFFDPQQRDLAYVRWQGTELCGWFDAFTVTASFHRQKEGTVESRTDLNANPNIDRTEVSEFDAQSTGLTFAFVSAFDDCNKLVYGVDLYHDDIDASRVRTFGAGSGVRNPQFPDDAYYERCGAFLTWDAWATDCLNVVSGVRYENIQTAGTLGVFQGPVSRFERAYSDWIFSVGASYELCEYVHAVGGVYEGFRAPNLDDLAADNTVQAGSSDSPSLNVRPEHSLTYEGGFKWNYPRLRGQSVFYWNDFEDRIQRQRFPNPNSTNFIRNNFDVSIYGVEFDAEYLLTDCWAAYGNYWYTLGEDLDRNEPVSRIPPQQGRLGLRWRNDCARSYFDIYSVLVDKQDRYADENRGDPRFPAGGNPAYATLNLRLGRTFEACCREHRLSLALENLTDTPYRVLGSGVDGPGFNAVLGYEIGY